MICTHCSFDSGGDRLKLARHFSEVHGKKPVEGLDNTDKVVSEPKAEKPVKKKRKKVVVEE